MTTGSKKGQKGINRDESFWSKVDQKGPGHEVSGEYSRRGSLQRRNGLRETCRMTIEPLECICGALLAHGER